ncbi:DUF4258 domain-containing protein [Kribbella pittospori]|uniref:DUF4258 domain-containing protein n=1 Tax=Kribbella pittospori TaxID=722689 RepID=A0A4R0KQV5_9ACTN|nr:DUF4258 domain-containing protein [Kribbella pittospori]TCC58305.1 DUF4258 domain-containing protein [Kribbella pittospori]
MTTSPLDYPPLMAGGMKLTRHARARMAERKIAGAELLATLTEAGTTRVVDGRGITVFGANGVAVVLNRAMTKILTVLPRGASPARWRGRNEGLRGYRRDPSNRRDRSVRRSRSGPSQRWGIQ